MPKITYVPQSFRADTLAVIERASAICEEYAGQGYSLTLRQLYYRFVAADAIPNTQQSYKRLGSIVNDGRMAGLIDWNHIEDRGRNATTPWGYDSPDHAIRSLANGYHINFWLGQPEYVEVWVEKEALIDVVSRACGIRDAAHFACKGYVSQSEMWGAAMRLRRWERRGKTTHIIHLGDHDPSGLDMTRDIRDRLSLFGSEVTVKRIALNMDQIEQYQPPPNFAKVTDSRYTDYQAEYGDDSWELDALEPAVLDTLIGEEIETHIDEELWSRANARLERERLSLTAAADNWHEVVDFMTGNGMTEE
jgi:hypothetical protein